MTQKAYITGVSLSFGILNLVVDTVPVRKARSSAKAGTFTHVCPDCKPLVKPEQRYQCPSCKTLMLPGERAKAREENGLLFEVDVAQVAAVQQASNVTADETLKLIFLRVCPLDELLAQTRPGETAYRLRLPGRKYQREVYNVLAYAARSEKFGLYGLLRLKESDPTMPFRLEVWNNQLVLQSLIRPQDLAEVDEEAGLPGAYLQRIQDTLEALCEPLAVDALRDGRVEKLEEILAVKDVLQAVPAREDEQDLMALLEASIAAAKVRNVA